MVGRIVKLVSGLVIAGVGIAGLWMSYREFSDARRAEHTGIETGGLPKSILSKKEQEALNDARRLAKQAGINAQAFVNAIREGRLESAYDLTSRGFRKRFDSKQFGEFVEAHPVLSKPRQICGNFSGSTNGVVEHGVQFGNSMEDGFTLLLVQEGDVLWVREIVFSEKN